MNDAQIWTMIGCFTAAIFGMMTVVSTLFVRVLRAEIGGLRAEMRSEISGLRSETMAEIGGLRAEMNARFEGVDRRLDGLDRDVQALVKHTFGFDRG